MKKDTAPAGGGDDKTLDSWTFLAPGSWPRKSFTRKWFYRNHFSAKLK